MTGPSPVRWGFLGAGFIAERALAPAVHAADAAVLQVVGARDVGRAASLDPVRAVDTYAQVCASADVDVVYIALPNDDHLPWVLQALAAGKHVLCEKPLGLTADEVATMTRAAQDAQRLLVEANWFRWHPRTQHFAELMAAAGPGQRQVETWFTFSGVPAGNYRLDPRHGGGALLDLGGYAISAALLALGTDRVRVTDVRRSLGPTGVDLTTVAILTHERGSATITGSFERAPAQGITVQAPELTVEFVGQAFTSWHQPCALRVTRDGVREQREFRAEDAYRLMVQAVSARAQGAQDAWVLPLSESAAVAATLDAIATAPGSAGLSG